MFRPKTSKYRSNDKTFAIDLKDVVSIIESHKSTQSFGNCTFEIIFKHGYKQIYRVDNASEIKEIFDLWENIIQ